MLVLLFVEFLLLVVAIFQLGLGNDRWGFAVVGILSGMISHAPFLSPRQPFFSMWGLAALSITFGAEVRGLTLALDYPSRASNDAFFLLSYDFAQLAVPAFISVVLLGLVVLGYVVTAKPRDEGPAERPNLLSRWSFRADEIGEGFVMLLAAGYVALGLVGTYNYYQDVGGLSGDINERRTVITESGTAFQSSGQWEFLSQAGAIGAILLLAYWLSTRKRMGAARWTVLALAFASSFSINVITTTRADLVDVGAAVAFVVAMVRGRVRFTGAIVLGLVVVLGIGWLTAERQGIQEDSTSTTAAVAVSGSLGNRNGYDLSKSAIIINAVPDRLSYQYGRTVAMLALTPIPRAVWPEKPVLTPGPIIGRTLYGLARSGVPPGISAELVWNFGILGALAAALVVGLLLGRFGRRYLPKDPRNLTALVVYALVVLPFGKAIVGVSIGQAVTIAAQELALLLPLLIVGRGIRTREAKQPRVSPPSRNSSLVVRSSSRVLPDHP